MSPTSPCIVVKPINQTRRLRFAGGGGGGGFLAREGGGGGGPFLPVDRVVVFAKLPCEVAGETDLSPYGRSGLLLLPKVESSWSLKTLLSALAESTVRKFDRVVLIVKESLGIRERRGAPIGEMSRRNCVGPSNVVDRMYPGRGYPVSAASAVGTSEAR